MHGRHPQVGLPVTQAAKASKAMNTSTEAATKRPPGIPRRRQQPAEAERIGIQLHGIQGGGRPIA